MSAGAHDIDRASQPQLQTTRQAGKGGVWIWGHGIDSGVLSKSVVIGRLGKTPSTYGRYPLRGGVGGKRGAAAIWGEKGEKTYLRGKADRALSAVQKLQYKQGKVVCRGFCNGGL